MNQAETQETVKYINTISQKLARQGALCRHCLLGQSGTGAEFKVMTHELLQCATEKHATIDKRN